MARPLHSYLLCASLLGSSCTSAPATTTPDQPPAQDPTEHLTAKVTGMGNVTLSLVLDIDHLGPRRQDAIRAWFFEAMAQSPWLDIATDVETQHKIILRADLTPDASAMTTTYVGPSGNSTPLAGVHPVTESTLVVAIDRLALETRFTLGEPPETVRSSARSAGVLVSPNEAVAAACAEARRLATSHQLARAEAVLGRAIQTDPACALARSLSAGVRMDQGLPRAALKRARSVGNVEERASPNALHRAARVLLLAAGGVKNYERLVKIAEIAQAERPRDPQVRFSKALGICLLARYEEALPILEQLRPRLPHSPGVLFCLGHALLATNHARQTKQLLPAIEQRVPPMAAARLHAWTLLALGEHKRLTQYLDRQARIGWFRQRHGELTMLRMRASHALLQGRDKEAGDLLIEFLDRLRGAPSLLQNRRGQLLTTLWVLGRIHRGTDAQRMLTAISRNASFAKTMRGEAIVASALARLGERRTLPRQTLASLDGIGLQAWSQRLEATASLRKGNARRAVLLLEAAAQKQNDPAVAFELAQALRQTGRVDEAKRIERALVTEYTVPRMDQPSRHPLLRPDLALIVRSCRG